MTMKKYISILAVMAAALLTATSCIRDLDIQPVDDDVVLPADILTGVEQYRQWFRPVYPRPLLHAGTHDGRRPLRMG